uniref:Uncharacterized protein n=1 Tax=Oryza brachyantha TaxID=4533 RepID=J3MR03_ORYBR
MPIDTPTSRGVNLASLARSTCHCIEDFPCRVINFRMTRLRCPRSWHPMLNREPRPRSSPPRT